MATAFEIVPLAPPIGAEIRGLDLRETLDCGTVHALYRAWLDHQVLVFRGAELSQQDVLRTGSYFGTVQEHHRHRRTYSAPGIGELASALRLISNIRVNGEPIGSLPDGEVMFHHDMSHKAVPNKATLLYALAVPSNGGDTLFASGYAAYESLDQGMRSRLEGKLALHRYNYGSAKRGDEQGEGTFTEWAHPVFRTHEETGKRALYVNRLKTVAFLDAKGTQEQEGLLKSLLDHSEKSEFLYVHKWREGDLVIWDNRCSSHARTDFPSHEKRLLLRAAIEGKLTAPGTV